MNELVNAGDYRESTANGGPDNIKAIGGEVVIVFDSDAEFDITLRMAPADAKRFASLVAAAARLAARQIGGRR